MWQKFAMDKEIELVYPLPEGLNIMEWNVHFNTKPVTSLTLNCLPDLKNTLQRKKVFSVC